MSIETRKAILIRLSNNGAIALTSGNALQNDSKAYLKEYLADFIILNKEAKKNFDKIVLLHREVTDLYNGNKNDFTKSSIGVMYDFYELLRDNSTDKNLMTYLEKHFVPDSGLNLLNYKAIVRSIKMISEKALVNDNFDYIAKFENIAIAVIEKDGKLPKVVKGALGLTVKQVKAVKGNLEKVYNVNSELKTLTNTLKRELQDMHLESLTKETLEKALEKLIPSLLEEFFAPKEEEKEIATKEKQVA